MVKRILPYAQPVFAVLALLFIAWLVRSQWDELRSYPWQVRWGWLAASAFFLVASWAVEVEIWRGLLRTLGGELPRGPAWRIWFTSAVMRYIPGNVWQPLSLTLQCSRRGVRAEAAVTSAALYQAVSLLAVAPITALYWATGGRRVLGGLVGQAAPWLLALALAPLLLFLLRPQWLLAAIDWALYKLGRPALGATLSTRQLLRLLAVSAFDWLLWGAAFATLAFALTAYRGAEAAALLPHLVAAFPVAYAIGFASLITPSGLGVREGALVLLLAPVMPAGIVTVIALAMRLWTTLGEVVIAGAMLVLTEAAAPAPVPTPVVSEAER